VAEDVVIHLGLPEYNYIVAYIAAGAALLIFGIPLLVRVVGLLRGKPRRLDAAPTWVLALLGLGVPLVAGGIAVVAAHRGANDFDTITVHADGGFTLGHSLTGAATRLSASDIGAVRLEFETVLRGGQNRSYHFAEVESATGAVLRSDRMPNRELLQRRLKEAGLLPP
jgi:hypothetical protein